jgi:16S rRNA (guanine527-N7)-methyltransferase
MMAPSRKAPANYMVAMRDKSAGDVLDRFCNTLLGPVLDTLGINLEREQVQQLTRHFALLLKWNQRINLTSVRKPEQIATRHYGESLFLASKITDMKGEVVDIGSGAGFPGIPIAIVKPHLQVTLVESVGKKAVFLKEVARDLQNVRIFLGRFENISRHFHWAIVRGVNLSRLLRAIASQADNLAIITSADEAGRLARNQSFKWQHPIPTPWGTGRVLVVGSRSENPRPHPSDSQAS